jgi:DNA-binding HxlR family transcriptional regulator
MTVPARKKKDFNPNNCPITYCMNFIGGKWKPVIIHLIREGDNRYSIFQRKIADISRQTLTNQLRELELDGVVERTIFPEIPPRVEYKLTDFGLSLTPILDSMQTWGFREMEKRQE